LTFIPLQADILVAGHVPTLATKVHLLWSAVFFTCALSHGLLVVFMQASCCSRRRKPSPKSSFQIKASLALLALLTLFGALPRVLLFLCPSETCGQSGTELRDQNLVGLAQHLLVLFICCFLASYAIDIHGMEKQKAEEEAALVSECCDKGTA